MHEIKELSWQRANLLLKLNTAVEKSAFLLSEEQRIPLEFSGETLRIPLSNLGSSMIEEGVWTIEADGSQVKVRSGLLETLDDASRIFRYGENLYALLISFSADENLVFHIEANYMMKNTKYKKKLRSGVFNKLTEKAETLFTVFALKVLNAAYRLLYGLNKRRNLVLFLSENSDDMSVNFRNLYEYISQRHKCISFSENLGAASSLSGIIREMLACSKARYIFLDNYAGFLSAIKIPESQKIYQIWHAGVGFKSVGYARFGKEGSPHPFVSVHRSYSLAFVDDEALKSVYSEVFGIPEDRIIASGLPRLVGYTDKEHIDRTVAVLLDEIPLLRGRKVILFAPTYRGSGSAKAYYDYTKIDFAKINEFCEKNNFIFVIKMHPFIREKADISAYPFICELSDHDINDLIYITDIMITDYSSCCYEYSFFDRPLIFYRYDKELYEYERPVHSIDRFTKQQYEAKDFVSLMDTLDSLKDIDISERFDNVRKQNNDSLRIISAAVFGEKS